MCFFPGIFLIRRERERERERESQTDRQTDRQTDNETGKQLSGVIVFSESIKCIKESLLEEVKTQQTDIGVDDIKWIFIVSSIWSDSTKGFMRRAAVEVYASFLAYSLLEKRERERKRSRERD